MMMVTLFFPMPSPPQSPTPFLPLRLYSLYISLHIAHSSLPHFSKSHSVHLYPLFPATFSHTTISLPISLSLSLNLVFKEATEYILGEKKWKKEILGTSWYTPCTSWRCDHAMVVGNFWNAGQRQKTSCGLNFQKTTEILKKTKFQRGFKPAVGDSSDVLPTRSDIRAWFFKVIHNPAMSQGLLW